LNQKPKNEIVYAFFDGDNISDAIEILLVENKIIEATRLSEDIKEAMYEIEKKLKSIIGVEIVIIGGDDLLIRYEGEKLTKAVVEDVRKLFKSKTGISMSCGIGANITESIQNLHLAKLYGRDQIRGLSY